MRRRHRSAPQIGAPHLVDPLGAMVPSWALGPCGRPTRPGAWRPCSRVRRRTRRLEVRTPAKRRRAQILRWPSPWNGLAASNARIASTNASSGIGPTGPGRDLGRSPPQRWRYTVARDAPRLGSPAERRKAGWRRARPCGLSPRPPPRQRAARLQVVDLGRQQFVGHGEITNLGLGAGQVCEGRRRTCDKAGVIASWGRTEYPQPAGPEPPCLP